MKKKWFSPTLYVEGLRQLRPIGIAYLVILELGAIFTCVHYACEHYYFPGVTSMLSMELIYENPLMQIGIFVFAPIMTFSIFHFLNKRTACDFYHAISETRISLFNSFFASILSWLLVGILISSLTSTVGTLFYSNNYIVIYTTIPDTLLYYFGLCFYLSGIVVLAMCATNTVFSNLIVSALIAVAPYLFLSSFLESIYKRLPVLAIERIPNILSLKYDPISFLVGNLYFDYDDYLSVYFDGYMQVGLYSLIIGSLYITAALLLFKGRHSEIAEQSAPNRSLQAVFRIIFTMLICLLPCMDIINNFGTGYSTAINTIFTYIGLYVLALVGYFLYEFFTTRKVKNLLHTIPTLSIVLLLNISLIGGSYCVIHSVLNNTPSPDDIKGVTFISGNGNNQHVSLKGFRNIHINNDSTCQFVSSRLKEELDQLNSNNQLSYDEKEYISYTVAIESPTKTIYRKLYFTDNEVHSMTTEIPLDNLRETDN